MHIVFIGVIVFLIGLAAAKLRINLDNTVGSGLARDYLEEMGMEEEEKESKM